MSQWMAFGILIVVLLYGVSVYNTLVQVKNAVSKAWANIDVLLKQRHDEIPKLVEVCRQYQKFEQSTLQSVIQARSAVQQAGASGNMVALGQAEGALRAGVGRLFAVAESYPELQANSNFMQLQGRISSLENAIADRREFYNESVNINNVQMESFPSNLIASRFGFKARELLNFDAAELADVNLRQLFDPAG